MNKETFALVIFRNLTVLLNIDLKSIDSNSNIFFHACSSDLEESPSMRISPTASNTSRESAKSSPDEAMMSDKIMGEKSVAPFSMVSVTVTAGNSNDLLTLDIVLQIGVEGGELRAEQLLARRGHRGGKGKTSGSTQARTSRL